MDGFRLRIGQSFTGNGAKVTDAKFYLSKATGATGNITATIYAHSGTYGTSSVGTGSALATSTPVSASSLSTSLALINFNFPSPYTVTNTTKYVVMVEYDGAGGTINVGRDTSQSHSGNQVLYTTDFGGNWVASAGVDTIFYVLEAGTLAWTNPDNSKVSDDVYSTAVNPSSGVSVTTHFLKASNFGFNFPSTYTINGIKVEVEKKSSLDSTDFIKDSSVKIIKSDGSFGSSDNATATHWSTSEGYVSYGSSSDLWGATWSPSDINNSNFGVVISAFLNANDFVTASVDHIRITIYYTPNGLAYELIAAFGTFVLTGQSAIITSVRKMVAALGTFTLTGEDSILNRGRMLIAGFGSFNLTYQNVVAIFGRIMTAAYGTFTLTGEDSLFVKSVNLIASTGHYVLSGQALHFLINGMNTIWSKITKHTNTFTSANKNTTTFNQDSKNSSTWTIDSKS
jgi:hypothetical protein